MHNKKAGQMCKKTNTQRQVEGADGFTFCHCGSKLKENKDLHRKTLFCNDFSFFPFVPSQLEPQSVALAPLQRLRSWEGHIARFHNM